MDIESQSLTTCEVAPDGNTIVLGFADPGGTTGMMTLYTTDGFSVCFAM